MISTIIAGTIGATVAVFTMAPTIFEAFKLKPKKEKKRSFISCMDIEAEDIDDDND
jgi:hypothetical protein